MTEIAKIALIGGEVMVTKYALNKACENMDQNQAAIYLRVIEKIDKASIKEEIKRARNNQMKLGVH